MSEIKKGSYFDIRNASLEDVELIHKLCVDAGFSCVDEELPAEVFSMGTWSNYGVNDSGYIEAWDSSDNYGLSEHKLNLEDFKKDLELVKKICVAGGYVEPRDNVNHPSHYKLFPNQEAIDIIRAALTEEEFNGYLKGNALKYRLRAGLKDPDKVEEDLGKADWYRNYLIELDKSE